MKGYGHLCNNSQQHTTDRVKSILLLSYLQWRPISHALMRTRMVRGHFPEAMLVPPIFGTGEPEDMKTLCVIGTMASFNKAILPRRPGLNGPMLNLQPFRQALKGGSPLRVGTLAHREGHRIVGHDEKKGGNRSQAR